MYVIMGTFISPYPLLGSQPDAPCAPGKPYRYHLAKLVGFTLQNLQFVIFSLFTQVVKSCSDATALPEPLSLITDIFVIIVIITDIVFAVKFTKVFLR